MGVKLFNLLHRRDDEAGRDAVFGICFPEGCDSPGISGFGPAAEFDLNGIKPTIPLKD